MTSERCVISLEQFRHRYWQTHPESLMEMSNIFWSYHKVSATCLRYVGFFNKYRLQSLSEHFDKPEDIVSLGVCMNFSWDVVDSLIRGNNMDIKRSGEILFTNYILVNHQGDEKTVKQIVNIFNKIGKPRCGMNIEKDFQYWSQQTFDKYKKLDEIEKKFKNGKTEKQLRVFGWQMKRTPERFFDYLGNFCSLKEYNKEVFVDLTKKYLRDMTLELLKNAPVEFAFQYLPSAAKYHYDSRLVLPLEWIVINLDSNKYYSNEKLMWLFTTTHGLDQSKFHKFMLKNFPKEEIFKEILEKYPQNPAVSTFQILMHVFGSESNSNCDYTKNMKILKMFGPFNTFVSRFEDNCKVEKMLVFKNISTHDALLYIIVIFLFFGCFKNK